MARHERYVVGLDIGTSKVCTVVGEMLDEGGVDVIGLGVAESKGLKRGVVVNLDAAVESINRDVGSVQALLSTLSERDPGANGAPAEPPDPAQFPPHGRQES